MDQRPYPGPPLLFHLRMSTLFTILWWTDCLMFLFAVERTLSSGIGGMVLFASEVSSFFFFFFFLNVPTALIYLHKSMAY